MELLSTLKRQVADNCVILTYNADLPFFEYMLFESLYADGCRNTLVLCDPAQYAQALRDTPLLRYAGQRYLLIPARTSPAGAFHPKMILLTSAYEGQLFLLSGNLTRAGYTRNLEVVTCFEYKDRNPDLTAWSAFQWALAVISRIVSVSDPSGLAQQRLEQLRGTTPWMRKEHTAFLPAGVWLLHNLDEPLLDQLLARYRQYDGSLVQEVVVISPFFDGGGQALSRLVAECSPRRLRLYTQGLSCGLDPRNLRAVLRRYDGDFQAGELDLGGRSLHAKVLLLRTANGSWLATGSANFSAPAWLHPAADGNTELVALRFVPDQTYFEPWLEEAISQSHPLDLDRKASPPERELPVPPPSVALMSATLIAGKLVLQLANPLPAWAPLVVRLTGDIEESIPYSRWQQEGSNTISLPLPSDVVRLLESPTLVALEIPTNQLWSNQVLLHNESALRNSSRPVDRRERPRVPDGLRPDSYEHCLELLEMLRDLLATNTEQLNRHRRRIRELQEKDRQERIMVVEAEGGYRPEDHLVDEKVRRIVTVSGADLYEDYYDRLTYEEVLRAALAAVYHPPAVTSSHGTPDRSIAPVPPAESALPKPPGDVEMRQQMMTRIAHGFDRLVGNFLLGLADEEYLAVVPPDNLAELYVIITRYLCVVWKDGMFATEPFLGHSLGLLAALWGRPHNAWQLLCMRSPDSVALAVERLSLDAWIWLHAYVVADLLSREGDRRIYDLAAIMRQIRSMLAPPDKALERLPVDVYQRLCQAILPASMESESVSAVAARLAELSDSYDHDSLLAEIAALPGARSCISVEEKCGQRQVWTLQVELPLVEADLDRCVHFFMLFLRWPEPKQAAWARFTNTNPTSHQDAIQSVTVFYRGDERSLVFAVRRPSPDSRPQHDPEILIEDVTTDHLVGVSSVADLCTLKTRRKT